MTNFHDSYTPGTELELTFDTGSTVRLASVIEGEAKRMAYTFCTRMADGSYVAFDVREVPQFANVFAGVSRFEKARLEALAKAMNTCFDGCDDFYAAIAKVAITMASRPAAHLH